MMFVQDLERVIFKVPVVVAAKWQCSSGCMDGKWELRQADDNYWLTKIPGHLLVFAVYCFTWTV